MKNYLLIFASILSTGLFGQSDQTLFSDVKRVGAFGGPLFEYTNLSDDVETAPGGGGAFVLDDFFLGGYGVGDVETNLIKDIGSGITTNEQVKFKHGGFWLGYVPMQHKVVHPYTSVRFGWGKARYLKTQSNTITEIALKDNLFVLSPEVGVEMNVFSFFRVSAAATYRLVSGVDDLPSYSDGDLSSFGAVLTLRFGGFGSYWD